MQTLHRNRTGQPAPSPSFKTNAGIKTRELFRKIGREIKNALLLEVLVNEKQFGNGLTPAYAMAGNTSSPLRVAREEKQLGEASYFISGNAPGKATPSRKIMEWESIDIRLPGEKGDEKDDKSGKTISYSQAQKEVTALLKDQRATHSYLAYEAAKLCSRNPFVVRYTLHLIAGAASEDLVFLPGESLEDMCVGDISRTKMSRKEFSKMLGGMDENPGTLTSIFKWLGKVAEFFTGGNKEKDALNRPYLSHFYDPTREPGDQGLNIFDGGLKLQSTVTRMQTLWKAASIHYLRGDIPRTFCVLGHMIHLVQDLHVPAHVHNDIHGPTILLGKLDSLEEWAVRSDYEHIARTPNEANIRIWNSKPISPPRADRTLTPHNIQQKLESFMRNIALNSKRFRSVDYAGTDENQKKTGKLSDEECFEQCNSLAPSAIRNSAQLIMNFLDYHERTYSMLSQPQQPQ